MGTAEWAAWDRELLLRLNGSDSLFMDRLMEGITCTWAWVPAGAALLYVLVRNNGTRGWWTVLLFLCLSIVAADQFSSSFCKPYFARFRPSQDPLLMYAVDVVEGYRGGRYGFISGHAANTFAAVAFLAPLFRSVRTTLSLSCWASLCSYSRIYLGVHYPGDVLCGAAWGAACGASAYVACAFFLRRSSGGRTFVSGRYTSTGYASGDLDVLMAVLHLTYVGLAVRAAALF